MKRTTLSAALLAALALLSACGGGSGSAGADGPSTDGGVTLTGVVAVGAPLADAQVDAWCGNGIPVPPTRTDANGRYEMRLPADCAGPWLMQASAAVVDGLKLLSILESPVPGSVQPGAPLNANITTLTDLMTRMTLPHADLDALIDEIRKLQAEEFRELMAAKLRETLAQMQKWVPPADPGEPAVVLSTEFLVQKPFNPQPGDVMDDLLEFIKRAKGNLAVDALTEQAQLRGGDLASGQPWKTVFGDRTTLTLSGTGCSDDPAVPATVTLRMQDRNLEVSMASSLFASPATFTVGPAVTGSDFQMEVGGASPVVQLRAGAPFGNSLSLSVDGAGAPRIAFGSAGANVNCALSNPVLRADLVAFHPAARIRSVVPATGASGNCAASSAGPAYTYAISSMGDVRFNDSSLPADWLDAPHAYYTESLQYGMGGSGPSYQVQMAALPTVQGIQPYFFSTIPYGLNCTAGNP